MRLFDVSAHVTLPTNLEDGTVRRELRHVTETTRPNVGGPAERFSFGGTPSGLSTSVCGDVTETTKILCPVRSAFRRKPMDSRGFGDIDLGEGGRRFGVSVTFPDFPGEAGIVGMGTLWGPVVGSDTAAWGNKDTPPLEWTRRLVVRETTGRWNKDAILRK